jgi:thiamine-phosphate pyrophosphorylase
MRKMPVPIQLYYITDRTVFPGDEATRRRHLLGKITEAARAGVEYIQLREKDLSTQDFETLAREAVDILREIQSETRNQKLETRLLVNSRTDVALAVEADGVHLRGDDISPREVVAIQSIARGNLQQGTRNLLTAVSCHSVEDVSRAEHEGATFAVLAPIFGKLVTGPVPALGLEALKIACQGKLPVFALGGVSLENTRACIDAGATGIAAIRLFQNNNIQEVVRQLRQP